MPTDIHTIIFEQILRIDPTLLYRYPTIQDQLLYLILIPHVVLILFLWSLSYWVVGRGHPGIGILISLVGYIYLIWSGWYGSLLVPIILVWFPLFLLVMFGFFIISRALHPLLTPGLSNVMKATAERVVGKPFEVRTHKERIEMLKKAIKKLEELREEALARRDMKGAGEIAKEIAALKIQLEAEELALKQAERWI